MGDRSREYFAEEVFTGTVRQNNKVYTGPILMAWMGTMLACFGMSAACAVSGHEHHWQGVMRLAVAAAHLRWHAASAPEPPLNLVDQ